MNTQNVTIYIYIKYICITLYEYEYYSYLQSNEILTHGTMWMKLEEIII
jgi:hypothetical protein